MKTQQPARRKNATGRNGDSNRGMLLRLELPSDPNLLCAVRGAVERLAESFGFSAEDARAVTRAVDEALTNIIRHAYGGRADRPIEMFFRAVHGKTNPEAAEGIEILLCDRGPAIKPEQLCMRALEEVRPGGLGLHFIQQSMDLVEYKRVNGTNRLRLVKYVHARKQEAKS